MPDYTRTALIQMAQPLREDEAKKEEDLRRRAALEAIAKPSMAGFGQASGAERLEASQTGMQRAEEAARSTAAVGQQMQSLQAQRTAKLAEAERGTQQMSFAETMQPREQETALRQQIVKERGAEVGMSEKEVEMKTAAQKAELGWQELAQNNNEKVREIATGIRQLSQQTQQAAIQREVDRYQFDQGQIDEKEYARREAAFQQQMAELQGKWQEKETYLGAMSDIDKAKIGANMQYKLAGYLNDEAIKSKNVAAYGVAGTVIGAVGGAIIGAIAGTGTSGPGGGTIAGGISGGYAGAKLGGGAGTAIGHASQG